MNTYHYTNTCHINETLFLEIPSRFRKTIGQLDLLKEILSYLIDSSQVAFLYNVFENRMKNNSRSESQTCTKSKYIALCT